MFSLNTNSFLTSKILTCHINLFTCIKQRKQCLCTLKAYNYNNYKNTNANRSRSSLCYNRNESNNSNLLNMYVKDSLLRWLSFNRKLCTKHSSKYTFGNISFAKYEKIEMSEAEKKEETFAENCTNNRKYKKMYQSNYINLIKTYLQQKDLNMALSVLDLVKENGDKVNAYMFELMIHAYAQQGNIKVCFKLYNKMKKHGIIPDVNVYTSLINACAESEDTEAALKYLYTLRTIGEQYILNETHYATFIKAYGRHGELKKSFEIADEAFDKRIVGIDIYTNLMYAANSDKKNGLKYALILWHQMKKHRMKLTLTHYNLLLRAIRDTELGDLKVNDVLISNSMDTQIQLDKTKMPDLLDSPPVVNTLLLDVVYSEFDDVRMRNKNVKAIASDEIILQSLNEILTRNKLILFGGVKKFMKRMREDNVIPDIKTITYILQILPNSLKIEEYYLNYINNVIKCKFDIHFFNVLMQRRNSREAYTSTIDVLDKLQQYHLQPDIMTFALLAVGCKDFLSGKNLLRDMRNFRYVPNYLVFGPLIHNATTTVNVKYLMFLMDYMYKMDFHPSQYILNTIQKFEKIFYGYITRKRQRDSKKLLNIKNDYNKFKIFYNEWKQKMQSNDIINPSKENSCVLTSRLTKTTRKLL